MATATREISVVITRTVEKQQTNRITYTVPASMTLEEVEREFSEDLQSVFDGDDADWDNGVKFTGIERGEEFYFGESDRYSLELD